MATAVNTTSVPSIDMLFMIRAASDNEHTVQGKSTLQKNAAYAYKNRQFTMAPPLAVRPKPMMKGNLTTPRRTEIPMLRQANFLVCSWADLRQIACHKHHFSSGKDKHTQLAYRCILTLGLHDR